jgi:hypothetical protein
VWAPLATAVYINGTFGGAPKIGQLTFWPGEVGNYPKSTQSIVTPAANGGAGFDAMQHDGLRNAVRGAVRASSFGQSAAVNFDGIAGTFIRKDSLMAGAGRTLR